MPTLLKMFFAILILAGSAITIFAAWEFTGTLRFLSSANETVQGTFEGYHREVRKTRNITSSRSLDQSMWTYSVATYPEFSYKDGNGKLVRVRSRKVHAFEYYTSGDAINILRSPSGEARIDGFYSLYVRDIFILLIGLGFLFFPLLFWKVAAPALQSPETAESFNQFWEGISQTLRDTKIGPFSLKTLFYGSAALFGIVLVFAIIGGLSPYLAQMRFGSGGRLLSALEHDRFEEAKELIASGNGLHATNEFNQNPLLLALEANQPELAEALIKAGADVNIKSKMLKSPIQVAVNNGDLVMVKLLLENGASPDAPEDEYPPVSYAMAKNRLDIARALIEGGTDLTRRYRFQGKKITVGDMALMGKKQEIVALIREMGGEFSN